jgi:hypothetical protein
MKARHLIAVPVATVCVAVAAAVVSAHAANIAVPPSSLGLANNGAAASQFKPSACTGTVSSIVAVPSGGALFTVSSSNVLIVGTSGNDNVKATGGYVCFVGGGPTASNADNFTGKNGSGDQCVVATSDPATNITRCSIVQRAP